MPIANALHSVLQVAHLKRISDYNRSATAACRVRAGTLRWWAPGGLLSALLLMDALPYPSAGSGALDSLACCFLLSPDVCPLRPYRSVLRGLNLVLTNFAHFTRVPGIVNTKLAGFTLYSPDADEYLVRVQLVTYLYFIRDHIGCTTRLALILKAIFCPICREHNFFCHLPRLFLYSHAYDNLRLVQVDVVCFSPRI